MFLIRSWKIYILVMWCCTCFLAWNKVHDLLMTSSCLVIVWGWSKPNAILMQYICIYACNHILFFSRIQTAAAREGENWYIKHLICTHSFRYGLYEIWGTWMVSTLQSQPIPFSPVPSPPTLKMPAREMRRNSVIKMFYFSVFIIILSRILVDFLIMLWLFVQLLLWLYRSGLCSRFDLQKCNIAPTILTWKPP